jgi:MFS family permease
VQFVSALRHLLRRTAFRRLYAVRVTGQLTDGIFQGGLASYVLFSPEKQTDAASIAGSLAVLLLPFSVLGPFVGIFLDRWRRRQIVVYANLLRIFPVLAAAVAVFLDAPNVVVLSCALVEIGINRFILAGLSAGLPRTVDPDDLVLANSVTPTSGTICFFTGLGLAAGLRHVFAPIGDPAIALVLIAAVGYGTAAMLGRRLDRDQLGPDLGAAPAEVRSQLGHVASGLLAAARHLRQRPAAALALGVVMSARFCYGITTVAMVLLYRNYFNAPSDPDAALAGLSAALLASSLGFFVAALITPYAAGRLGTALWIVVLLGAAAVSQALLLGMYSVPGVLGAVFCLGVVSQGIKICVETLLQRHTDDVFRGRVFALYDVAFNLAFVAAGTAGALALPDDGKSYGVLLVVVTTFALSAVGYSVGQRVVRPTSAAVSATS